MTSAVALSEYFLKFSLNLAAKPLTSLVKRASPWTQFLAGFKIPLGTFLTAFGICKPKVGKVSYSASAKEPLWMASKMALVESGFWLSDTFFGTSHFGGVTGDEVVHDLGVGQLGDWRQDTTGVTGQKDNVLWVLVSVTWQLCGWNVFDWVSTSGVLSDGGVIVVDNSGFFIVDNVFQHGTELDRTKDFWLLFTAQVQTLGVTTTFDVEHTFVGPAVLVVTNQQSVWVGRQGGLTGTGQTKEQRDVLLSDTLVGRGVQGQNVVVHRHQVEHHSEDPLLHLTSVLGTQDNHLHVLEVDLDRSRGGHTLSVDVGWELTSVVNCEIWLTKVLQLFVGRLDQHISHEQSMVSSGTHNSNLQSVLWVPAGKGINNEDLFPGSQVVVGSGLGDLPGVFRNLLVNRTPPNLICGGFLIDNSLVLWRSTSLVTRVRHQGTGGGDGSLLFLQTVFV
ncbi:hypothetical protein WICPIJ_002751 [Wickerhamomyces pijperi]|uniref:Uncharacterized protein n=1 Tax=Wickerhamomyces pijperi TaxID=599730 RepID=A0A9P8TPI7_WICPI|nr:hypothetical protein WICPIJ_002751 [Wickerhamomyces pijperi]